MLRHSIDLGHRRLALHRFFLATAMDSPTAAACAAAERSDRPGSTPVTAVVDHSPLSAVLTCTAHADSTMATLWLTAESVISLPAAREAR